MKTNSIKLLTIAAFVAALFGMTMLPTTETRALGPASEDDVAAVYKAKCVACHSPKAEKAYNPEKPMEEQIEAILKGVKTSKPPMPGYETKGITPEQAKALAEYMKQLRTPAN